MLEITVQDIIDKRKKLWNENHDLDLDKQLVEASARKILETPSLREEIQAKPYLLIEVALDRKSVV